LAGNLSAASVDLEREVFELLSSLCADQVANHIDLARMAGVLGSAAVVDPDRHEVTVEAGAAGGGAAVVEVVRTLDSAGITVDDVLLRRPTLDEVFLHLTAPGHVPDPEGAAR
ncbi:hypothetical protein ABT284_09090, partial [Nocardioides sp. NPDC000441]